MPILPDEMAEAIFTDSIALIQAGQFSEEQLRRWGDVIWTQIKAMQATKAAAVRAFLQVGDTVRFCDTTKPQLLRGALATVTGRQGDKIVVDLHPTNIKLFGSKWAGRGGRNVRCPAQILEPVSRPKPQSTTSVRELHLVPPALTGHVPGTPPALDGEFSELDDVEVS